MAERRFTLVFFVAIATAAAATFGVYRVLDTTKKEAQIPTRAVVVTTRDLPEGSRLDAEMLAVKQWPAPTVPEGAFDAADSLVGRVTRVAVFNGEPIVPGRLAPVGSSAGLEVKITPGKRAMAVRINDVAGIAGLIQPNSRVDVLVSLRDESSRGQQVAKLFMENMRVLSVGTQIERGADGQSIQATTATLEVTPQEAERLLVATNTGSIQLVLRGFGETDSARTRGAQANDVLASLQGYQPAPPPRAAPPPAPRRSAPAPRPAAPAPAPVVAAPAPPKPDTVSVEIYRGSTKTDQKFVKKDSSKTP
ncbi:Flp pilus assembly protein CpaB [Roseisolibacter sp. H3M3-2]|uniref:Flp pilus assembly protein CpaB n=1 Tax=Roseisolibacter sp. H3M3-2 TaxID=3031323 RepID=UPI0023D9C834|nr:Flp pilus assembly protein CpaB [Roseisolibacter sp. H3M3-2]MDF1501873.1 Flp pilus assembly protein CpaB [Roseisolibacter sp. H3M3-2]